MVLFLVRLPSTILKQVLLSVRRYASSRDLTICVFLDLHPHSTLAANPPIETITAEGSTGDASTKSLPGSRVETPSSFSDTPPGLACSNGRGDHHAAHSQPAEDRTHQPSGLAATVLPEVPPPVSLIQVSILVYHTCYLSARLTLRI